MKPLTVTQFKGLDVLVKIFIINKASLILALSMNTYNALLNRLISNAFIMKPLIIDNGGINEPILLLTSNNSGILVLFTFFFDVAHFSHCALLTLTDIQCLLCHLPCI